MCRAERTKRRNDGSGALFQTCPYALKVMASGAVTTGLLRSAVIIYWLFAMANMFFSLVALLLGKPVIDEGARSIFTLNRSLKMPVCLVPVLGMLLAGVVVTTLWAILNAMALVSQVTALTVEATTTSESMEPSIELIGSTAPWEASMMGFSV